MRSVLSALRLTLVLAVLCGLLYPLLTMGIGQALFPNQAQGSLIKENGQVVGSRLIGQYVTNPDLFVGRPSATVNPQTGKSEPYAANNSGGDNLGPTNRATVAAVGHSLARVMRQNPGLQPDQVPPDLVESSASGLDPDISPQAALLQIPRIARRTGLSQSLLRRMVRSHEHGRFLGIFGAPTVNVLELNLALRLDLTHAASH